MKIKLIGKKYQSIRINLEGHTFDTPKKGQTLVLDVLEMPVALKDLESLNFIKIETI